MRKQDPVEVVEITSEALRDRGLGVLESVYRDEKAWTERCQELLPASDLEDEQIAWFLAFQGRRSLGVLRVLYRIPVELYASYAFDLVDDGIDVQAFMRDHKIAEIGRFAVVPAYRDRIQVAMTLMREATAQTVARGYTHYLTDVFENDPNSPYGFHRRILGFETVATHEVGELAHKGRRITMLLDLRAAFQRLRQRRRWVFRTLTMGWNEQLLSRLATP